MNTYIKTNSGENANIIVNMAVAVTPHDTDTFQKGLLYIGTGGNVKLMPSGQSTFVTFSSVADGTFLPVIAKAVHTDTTASNILVCY